MLQRLNVKLMALIARHRTVVENFGAQVHEQRVLVLLSQRALAGLEPQKLLEQAVTLADIREFQVVGEACTGQELLALVTRQPSDVVLLDPLLPDLNSLMVLQALQARCPGLPVLVFSVQPELQYAMWAFKAGAVGYLTKRSLPQELVRAIRKVARGGRYASASLAEYLLATVRREADVPLICASPIESSPSSVASPPAKLSKNRPPSCR